MQKIVPFLTKIKQFILSHKIISIGLIVLVFILFLIFRPKPQPPIDTVAVHKHNLVQIVSASGSVDVQNKVTLSFLAAGQLVYIGAKVNDTVTAGQIIAQVDTRTVEKNLQSALLTASEQRNTYDQTIYNNKDHVLDDSMRRILQNNQYDLEKSINSVELQDLARQQSFLVSPISGVLTRADAVSVGTTATATTLFQVVDPESLVFKVEVDEADIGKIRIGQPVTVTLDAYPTTPFQLTVDSVDYESHTTASGGTAYYVSVKLPGEDIDKFRLGLNGDADITTAKKNNVLTLPLSSLEDDTYVYLKKNNKYIKRKVILGLQNDTDVEVLSGISEGDIVAVQPTKVPQSLVSSK